MTYNTIAELLAAKPELEKVRAVHDATDAMGRTGSPFMRRDHAEAAILEVANAVGTCDLCSKWSRRSQP